MRECAKMDEAGGFLHNAGSRPRPNSRVTRAIWGQAHETECKHDTAIDSQGATIEFFRSAFHDLDAAKSLFRRGLGNGAQLQPQLRAINTNLAPTYALAIPALKRSGVIGRRCKHRPVQYLTNIMEQYYRAIKKRANAKQGFCAFGAARRTVDGYEAVHMMRKGQVRWLPGHHIMGQIRFVDQLFGL